MSNTQMDAISNGSQIQNMRNVLVILVLYNVPTHAAGRKYTGYERNGQPSAMRLLKRDRGGEKKDVTIIGWGNTIVELFKEGWTADKLVDDITEVQNFAATAEHYVFKNGHWEVMLKCSRRSDNSTCLVNIQFGKSAKGWFKGLFQNRGTLLLQIIDWDELEEYIRAKDNKFLNAFKSATTKQPLIPDQGFLNKLKASFENHCLVPFKLRSLIDSVKGASYSMYAHTNPFKDIHNCQTMSRKIHEYCVNNDARESMKIVKDRGIGYGLFQCCSNLMNCTIIAPLVRSQWARCPDLPSWVISKDDYAEASKSDDNADKTQKNDMNSVKDFREGVNRHTDVPENIDEKEFEPSRSMYSESGYTISYNIDDLHVPDVPDDCSQKMVLAIDEVSNWGRDNYRESSKRRRLVTLEQMIEL